jgi:hypothetical protein
VFADDDTEDGAPLQPSCSTMKHLPEMLKELKGGFYDVNPQFVPYTQARELMRADEARANDRAEFDWVLAFRSIMVANGKMPGRVAYGDIDLHFVWASQVWRCSSKRQFLVWW